MTTRMRHTTALVAAATAAALTLPCAQAIAAATVAPLPPSAYTTRSVCPPPAPGHVACMAQALVARTAQASAHDHPLGVSSATMTAPSPANGDFGFRPRDVHSAYQLPTQSSGTQTIALVDAYNDLSAEADLETYDTEFGLPKCTAANGCFTKVNQSGETANLPFPRTATSLTAAKALCTRHEPSETKQQEEEREEACFQVEQAEGWSVEISLDIETARATCQNCHIALVEADSTSYEDLDAAEGAAVRLPAQEVSNSWGGAECEEGLGCVEDGSAFDHPGVVITASAGDDGYLNWLEEPRSAYASFPASSPDVVAVGGTRLYVGAGGEWAGERVWNDGGESAGVKDGHGAGGGGCSVQFAAQPWQRSVADWSQVGCGNGRAVADVSADADPYTGLAVYDSSPECETRYKENGVEHAVHWCTIGGTSLASPLVASVFALAGGAQGVEYPARTLYQNAAKTPATVHDVSEGSNGECLSPFDEEAASTACTPAEEAATSCSSHLICLAATGYDGPTGVGTPDGIAAFQPLAGAADGEPGEETGKEAGKEAGEEPAEGEEETLLGRESGSGKSKAEAGVSAPAPASRAPAAPQPAPTVAPTPSVNLYGLSLALKASIAKRSSHLQVTQVGYTFELTIATHVRVLLQKLLGGHGHTHWKTTLHSRTIVAAAGLNSQHLAKRSTLGSGTFKLTLTPAQGIARSIVFKLS
jgi:subtilase family protein